MMTRRRLKKRMLASTHATRRRPENSNRDHETELQ